MAINLPIPKEASLAYLYKRWGYLDNPADFKLFCENIRRFLYADGLKLDYFYGGKPDLSLVEREQMDDFFQSFLIPNKIYYPRFNLVKKIILDSDDNIIKGDNRANYWNYLAFKMPKDWLIDKNFTRRNIRVSSLEPVSGVSPKNARFYIEVSSDYTPLYFLRLKMLDQEYILSMKNSLSTLYNDVLVPEFIDKAKYLQELASHENRVGSLHHPVFVAFKELNLSMYDIHITRDNLREFEQRMGICDHGLKLIVTPNHKPKPKKIPIQEQREKILKKWLVNQNIEKVKAMKKEEVWVTLQEEARGLFNSNQDGFFKKQKIIKFNRGKRKNN